MTLEVLKSEALKLEKLELNEAQKSEITQRLKNIENTPTTFTSGLEVEKQLISKYGLEV